MRENRMKSNKDVNDKREITKSRVMVEPQGGESVDVFEANPQRAA